MDLAGGQHGLDCNAALGILLKQIVEDGVTDLGSHLVGMTLGDGFRGKEVVLCHARFLLVTDSLRFVSKGCDQFGLKPG